jgi:tetratricopeptide (TPR) repeat protein
MMDYETDMWEELFYDKIGKAIEVGEEQIRNNNEDPWIYFYLGSSYSYKGLYKAKKGKYISGLLSARKGVGYLKEAIEHDSTLYDAYLGVGSYKYWASKYLKWLPWVSDKRDAGVEMVKAAVEKGTFSYWVGLNSLGWIEYDRKEYESAMTIFQRGVKRYPESRFFIWGLADAAHRLKNFNISIRVYEDLLNNIQHGLFNNGYNEIECRIKLVMAYYEQDEYGKALYHCNEILNKEVEKKIANRVEKQLEQAKKFKKRCYKKMSKQKVVLE